MQACGIRRSAVLGAIALGAVTAALALLSASSAGASASPSESHSVPLTLHPDTDLALSYHALTSDTQPYDLEYAGFLTTVETGVDPQHGAVVESIRFDSGTTYFTETNLRVLDQTQVGPLEIDVNPVDPFGTLTPTLIQATAVDANTATFDVSPIDYTWSSGFVNYLLVIGGMNIGTVYFGDENVVFPLAGEGSAVLLPDDPSPGMATLFVTLPFDSFAEPPWAFELSGEFVMSAVIELPEPSRLVGLLAGLLTLALLGRRVGSRAGSSLCYAPSPGAGSRSARTRKSTAVSRASTRS